MDALCLVHEAVLVAAGPTPSLVSDHLLTVPALARRLRPGCRRRRGDWVVEALDISETTSARVGEPERVGEVLPISLPAVVAELQRGLPGTATFWVTTGDGQAGRMVAWRLNRDPSGGTDDLSSFNEAPSADDDRGNPPVLGIPRIAKQMAIF